MTLSLALTRQEGKPVLLLTLAYEDMVKLINREAIVAQTDLSSLVLQTKDGQDIRELAIAYIKDEVMMEKARNDWGKPQ